MATLHYISCTTTEINEPGIYAEVKVLCKENIGYNPLQELPSRMSTLTKLCGDYVKHPGPFIPTELAEWLAYRMPNVREVGVFNADGSGVIISVE